MSDVSAAVDTPAADPPATDPLEALRARHRRELKDLQGRLLSKKKNATKKNRKGVVDECQAMERRMADQHADELATLQASLTTDDGGETRVDEMSVDETTTDERTVSSEPADNVLPSQPETLPARSSPPPDPSSAPKKRNRQKERLARRQAEVEAEAAAAEAEAATMVNHGERERQAQDAELGRLGMVECDIEPDGHCLFRAVADQIVERGPSWALTLPATAVEPVVAHLRREEPSQNGPQHITVDSSSSVLDLLRHPLVGYRVLRHVAADHMAEHSSDFAPFLPPPTMGHDDDDDDSEETSLDERFRAHVDRVRRTAEWGGHLELQALANALDLTIHIVQQPLPTLVLAPAHPNEARPASPRNVWLSYRQHGYSLGEHYNSLRDKS